jgi:GntR family transcriptional regulator of arabinose operon
MNIIKTKYIVVYEYIRTYIDQKKFTSNTKIPSENFICNKFSVSRETVRTAIKKLVDEGLVYTVKGSGTYFNKSLVLLDNQPAENGKIKIGFIAQGQDYNANCNIVKGIKSALDSENIDLNIFLTDNKLANERKCLNACSTGFHGLIIDGVKASILNPNLDYYSTLYEKDIRIIFFNNFYIHSPFPKVIIDDAKCADELIRRLTEQGHTRIAGIFVYDNYQGIEKYKGYIRSLDKYGAAFDDKYVKWCISDEAHDRKNFSKTLLKFIKSIPLATAIVCCNYMILKIVLELLETSGKKVPDDYSIVCFDYSNNDWEESGITSSIHPAFQMGIEVSKRIIAMVQDADYKSHDYSCVFPPNIYEGSSIKRIKKQ